MELERDGVTLKLEPGTGANETINFKAPTDEFFLFAYNWVVNKKRSPLSLARFVYLEPWQEGRVHRRDIVTKWFRESADLKSLNVFYMKEVRRPLVTWLNQPRSMRPLTSSELSLVKDKNIKALSGKE